MVGVAVGPAYLIGQVVSVLVIAVPIVAVAIYSIRRWRSTEWEGLARSRGEALADARQDLSDERNERKSEVAKLHQLNSNLRERVAALEAEVSMLRSRTDVTPLAALIEAVAAQTNTRSVETTALFEELRETVFPMLREIHQSVIHPT